MTLLLQKYLDYLPLESASSTDSLGEGHTPLVQSSYIGGKLGTPRLFFKSEHMNPTGSFKDRFAAVEVALMREAGIKSCIATSSGNTGSALAAYSARNNIRCYIFLNEITPIDKLTQMLVYGARLFRVEGFGISEERSRFIFQRLHALAKEAETRLVVSAYEYSSAGMEGVKTIAYELVEQLKSVPDLVFVPVGGGGLLTAIWRGFVDLKAQDLISSMPRIIAVQPRLNDTVVTPFFNGSARAQVVNTTTSVSGLAVQIDIDATRALKSVRESKGFGVLVSDNASLAAQKELSMREGLYVEPAGAVSVAGFMKAVSQELVQPHEKVVCILSGHGFKDPTSAGLIASNSEVDVIDPAQLKLSLFG
ncbi:MAG TPA: threonine synthase [Pyrinomonadaceae bacterium]